MLLLIYYIVPYIFLYLSRHWYTMVGVANPYVPTIFFDIHFVFEYCVAQTEHLHLL